MTDNNLCLICQENLASKKNSHIIPSFLIAPIFSYDGSNKRGSEVMVTITPTEEKVFTAEIPSTKVEELFDSKSLTEERINNELKINTAARDYIFCPKCENNLSLYLEGPYSVDFRKNKSSRIVPYFFWMSVIWRVSISDQFGVKLDSAIENELGSRLKAYFDASDAKDDATIERIITESSFRYRILRFDGYIADSPGTIVSEYDADNKILSIIIGELIICASFDSDEIPGNYSFFGSEVFLREAPINNGTIDEIISHHEPIDFEEINKKVISTLARQKVETEYDIINYCWHEVGLPGNMPSDIFMAYMNTLLSDSTKLGDRMTNERRIEVFNSTLQSYGYVPLDS